MAIFQNFLSFFLPTPRRGGQAGGRRGVDDSATQKVLEGIEGVLEPFNVPDHVTEYLESDLKDAFDIKGPTRPGYEPGRVGRAKFNVIDLVTDPLGTAWETVLKPFEPEFSEFLYTPDDFLSQVNDAVWEYLYTEEWGGVVPYSTVQAVARWGEANSKSKPRILRHLAAQTVRDNPGMTAMMSTRLLGYYGSLPAGSVDPKKILDLSRFGVDARDWEGEISSQLFFAERSKTAGDKALAAGQVNKARQLWAEADKYWSGADELQKNWKKVSEGYRENVQREFKRLASKGGSLYNTSEARFIRYWESRNKHYATLQFLRAYKEDGFWGVVKVYGWDKFTKGIENIYYASKLGDALNSIAGKLGIHKLLGKLTDAQTLVKRLKVGFWIKKGVKNLVKKLGITKWLGGIIGSVLPGAGTTVGAIIGAVIQFAGEVVFEKLGGVLKILGTALVGVIGCLGLFVIWMVVLISTILGNISYPWEISTTEVDCNQSATATDSCVLPKSEIKRIADDWGEGEGNHVEECYHDVIAKAKVAGVDPAFAMAIWLNESNASNYNISVEDFGVHRSSVRGFTAQIGKFLSYPDAYPANYPQCFDGHLADPTTGKTLSRMEVFLFIFRAGAGVNGKCDLSDPSLNATAGFGYARDIPAEAYSWVRPKGCSAWSYPNKK